jgi:hypothetical protein
MLCLAASSGCSLVSGGRTQAVKVEAVDVAGAPIRGARCTLLNQRGEYVVTKAPGSVIVARSEDDMSVVCKAARRPKGEGRLVSRVGAGMWQNILMIGGGIGAIVDHASGAAYHYPSWIRIVMGKSFTYDRNDEPEGGPTPPREDSTRRSPAVASAPLR